MTVPFLFKCQLAATLFFLFLFFALGTTLSILSLATAGFGLSSKLCDLQLAPSILGKQKGTNMELLLLHLRVSLQPFLF